MCRYPQSMENAGIRGFIGFLGAAAGGVAIWWGLSNRNETVMLAALGVGTLLLYLAYSGQQLTAFKAGGVEATLTKVVDEVVNNPDVPTKVKERVSYFVEDGRASAEARHDARIVLSNRRLAMNYENDVGEALARIGKAPKRGWGVRKEQAREFLDFQVTRKSDQMAVSVECRWSSDIPTERQLMNWQLDVQKHGQLGQGCVLVLAQQPPQAQGRGVVVWRDDSDDDRLAMEIEHAFA